MHAQRSNSLRKKTQKKKKKKKKKQLIYMAILMIQRTSVSKSAAILLLLVVIWVVAVLPSSASRIVGPKESAGNAMKIPRAASNNNNGTASVYEYCNPFCNDVACKNYYPYLCDGQPSNCFQTCDCAAYSCYCFCPQ
ncbi:unnamed protein product [Linum trigynum]|uniref:Uncharacterized protein n=1 Tax=Linum trigynum TaxID=586398 RepID=A0AAV2G2D2_9ROSI